jgi:2,3-diketo-5-methylthio-1-phosphopentane phosphatase
MNAEQKSPLPGTPSLSWIAFCDFDGTVTQGDVGNRFSDFFSQGRTRPIVQRWLSGDLTARRCLEEECKLLNFDVAQFESFLAEQTITPGFHEFIRFLEAEAIPLFILSDGLDLYISRLLEREQLNHIPVFVNCARIEGSRVIPEFPYFAQGCGRCGNCKKYHIQRLRQPGQKVLFVGDGYSDRCAAEAADLIFARGDFLQYCRERNIATIPFASFFEIAASVKTILRGETPVAPLRAKKAVVL